MSASNQAADAGDAVQSMRRASLGRPARHDMLKEWFLYGVIVLLLALMIGVMWQSRVAQQRTVRPPADLIAAGRRFVDYFFSLNASTVDYDQFRAIKMMTDPTRASERLEYLKHVDLVRRVQEAGTSSHIEWSATKTKVIEMTDEGAKVEFNALLYVDRAPPREIDMILTLKAVPRSDDNPDGVGVVSWIDVAKEPFHEGTPQ